MLIAFVAFAFNTPCSAKCATDNDVGIHCIMPVQVDVIADQVSIAENNLMYVIDKNESNCFYEKSEIKEVEFYRKTYDLISFSIYNFNLSNNAINGTKFFI
ncbi:MAG: hypothetical protein WCT77_00375 [Bacteroidota bacterium]